MTAANPSIPSLSSRRHRGLRALSVALAGAALLVGCTDEPLDALSELDEDESLPSDERPGVDAPGDLLPPSAPVGSICGNSIDWQDVESYDGSLGPSVAFVDTYERPVVQIRFRSDLDDDDLAGVPVCTGTLVSRNMVLTAGHCFDLGFLGFTPAEAATSMVAELEYQDDPNGNPRPVTTYAIEALLEWELDDIDYAVVRVEDNPGIRWGVTGISRTMPAVGDALTIIQHPQGIPEVVESGVYDGELGGLMRYDDIDTEGGSSGSAVLDAKGEIVGVHVQGGCDTWVGSNGAEPIDEILAVSDVLDDLVDGDIPLVGDLDGDDEDEMIIWRPTSGRWYAKRSDGTPVFPAGAEPVWGVAGDIPLVGDLDGDGDDEMVIWRPFTGKWYGLRREGTRIFPQGSEPVWGIRPDVPLLGDLDGDGDDEMVVWRASDHRWYGLRREGTAVFPVGTEPSWGNPGDVPMLGDVDGDGIDDLVQWRTSTYRWYVLRTDGTRVFPAGSEPVWGTRGDIPMVADLDGAGGEDMIVWRPTNGRWYGKRVDGTRIFPQGAELQYGVDGDMPLVGDFDGNGSADAVLWRPSNATWWAKTAAGVVLLPGITYGLPY